MAPATEIVHALVRVESDGAARELGVLVFSYASAYETPHIKYVRVHKADGSTVETAPDTAMEMAAGVTREAPLYSDLKEKHLAVRSLGLFSSWNGWRCECKSGQTRPSSKPVAAPLSRARTEYGPICPAPSGQG